ncbi:hypothetical protein, partial [Klebsiella michiganensis]|uniref:hypothetical protein n=1 Tax=Klebsiella michiganensis TaxID=1134687 RepID=UPI0013D8A934
LSDLARIAHRPLDEGVLRVLGEEQNDLAARALPGITVLQSSGAIAKHALAARALNLDGTHRTTMINENGSSGEAKCLKKD